jgi:biotin carboxyl carrier protein
MKIYKVKVNGKLYEVELESVTETNAKIEAPKAETPKPETSKAPVSGSSVPSPMQGTILKVAVAEGTAVKKGTLLVILEAMKLENEILAPTDGTVRQILVAKGQTVDAGQPLVILG